MKEDVKLSLITDDSYTESQKLQYTKSKNKNQLYLHILAMIYTAAKTKRVE